MSEKLGNNTDGDSSGRERRKLTRRTYSDKRSTWTHDETQFSSGSEKDMCDCLGDECPGCHFPCPKCRSCKCGYECRINRKWSYEVLESEGGDPGNKNSSTSLI